MAATGPTPLPRPPVRARLPPRGRSGAGAGGGRLGRVSLAFCAALSQPVRGGGVSVIKGEGRCWMCVYVLRVRAYAAQCAGDCGRGVPSWQRIVLEGLGVLRLYRWMLLALYNRVRLACVWVSKTQRAGCGSGRRSHLWSDRENPGSLNPSDWCKGVSSRHA